MVKSQECLPLHLEYRIDVQTVPHCHSHENQHKDPDRLALCRTAHMDGRCTQTTQTTQVSLAPKSLINYLLILHFKSEIPQIVSEAQWDHCDTFSHNTHFVHK